MAFHFDANHFTFGAAKNLALGVSSPLQPKNIKIQAAEMPSAVGPQNSVSLELATDSSEALTQTRTLLKNTLEQYSPQELKRFADDTDSRMQMYAGNRNKEAGELFVDRVTRRVNYGKAQGESAEQLNALMDRISQGADEAHSETRNILAALSKLDPASESYIADSQTHTRFALDELNAKISEDEALSGVSGNRKSFSMQVTTCEGDEVTINIKQNYGNSDLTAGSQISVNYEVEGDLSESEHQALSELMNAVGSASDSLLAGNDLTQLMGIADFNGQQLADFSLNLQGSDQNVEYSYSQDGSKQNLEGSWTQDGKEMADFNLSSKLGGISNKQELEQYLELLDEAADSTYKDNQEDKKDRSSRLFKNAMQDFMGLAEKLGPSLNKAEQAFEQTRALADTLFMQISKEQTQRLGLKDEEKARLKEGFNRLADFSASFTADGGRSRGIIRSSGYKVELSQHTQQDTVNGGQGDKQGIKQSRKVKLDSVMGETLDRNYRDHKLSEEYEIKAVIADASLEAVKQNRTTKEHLKEKIYAQGGESVFKQIDRDIKSEDTLYFLKEGMLESSRLTGSENTQKAIMAGDQMIAQIEDNEENHNYSAELFKSKGQEYREAQSKAKRIESEKRILDSVLDSL